ncbi:MAG: ribosome biogenesis GTPase YlqF [Clostridia bacterium]|nr:ribosome biogenesis GTPase YlqF [Clostridia bacterium]
MNINWYPGHMVKTKRQILEDLKLIDIVLELVDARIPISSQNPDIKEIVGNKNKIVVLNKCDLAQEKENQKWVRDFENKGIKAVLTDSNSGEGVKELIRAVKEMAKEEISQMAKKGRVGKSVRIMILGIPNVGKSSLINRMAKKTSAGVGNKPGFTKQKQWIRVSDEIELLDTPGILWPKFESKKVGLHLSVTGTIKDEILEKTEMAFYLVKWLIENEEERLLERYKMSKEELKEMTKTIENPNEQVIEIINRIAKKRGAILSGGYIDEERVAGIIIDDFRTGKMGRITLETVK